MSILKKDNVNVDLVDGKIVTDSNYVEISIEEAEEHLVGTLRITRVIEGVKEHPVIIINPKGTHKYYLQSDEELVLSVGDKQGKQLEEVVIVKEV